VSASSCTAAAAGSATAANIAAVGGRGGYFL
jgi:hypothetical protein